MVLPEMGAAAEGAPRGAWRLERGHDHNHTKTERAHAENKCRRRGEQMADIDDVNLRHLTDTQVADY